MGDVFGLEWTLWCQRFSFFNVLAIRDPLAFLLSLLLSGGDQFGEGKEIKRRSRTGFGVRLIRSGTLGGGWSDLGVLELSSVEAQSSLLLLSR